MTGTSVPIDTGGVGPQRATRASEKSIGHGRAICEYIEIMQILPGSSDDDARLIDASGVICKISAA